MTGLIICCNKILDRKAVQDWYGDGERLVKSACEDNLMSTRAGKGLF